jgi:hypothetical protein
MMLVLSLVLALIPVLGILFLLTHGSLTSVDGLFMSLILAAMSGIFALNAFREFRKGSSVEGDGSSQASGRTPSRSRVVAGSPGAGGSVLRGRVADVQFFESHVGQPSKSIVTFATDGLAAIRTLALAGDLRNRLPTGKRVQLTLQNREDGPVLLDVSFP